MLVVDGTARRRVQRLMDPMWFIPRYMKILDKHGRLRVLDDATMEQMAMLRSMVESPNTLALKSRQLGISTIVALFFAHRSLFSKDQYNVLTLTHEMEAMSRMNQMLRTALDHIPVGLRPTYATDNAREIGLAHNSSVLKQNMAGGRSGGRSYTFQGLWATEMGFWPRGSAATASRGADAEGADEVAWASVQATLHDSPRQRIVIESTANGPMGIFHKQVLVARGSPTWAFLFFPWYQFPDYRLAELPGGWERTDEEEDLARLFDIDDHQLAWRRRKLVDGAYSLTRFRKEYPTTWEEPFLLSDGMWFDVENLNRQISAIDKKWLSVKSGARLFRAPEPNRKYYIGVDPSGGVGKDAGTIQVLRDDWHQVASFSTKEMSARQLAEVAAEMSAAYGKARILCEENNHGRACLDRLKSLGCHLYKTDKGKDVWVDRVGKTVMMTFARECVDKGYVALEDPMTVSELLHVREQRDGNIEADEGYNDDHVSALVLALHNARGARSAASEANLAERAWEHRLKRHRELGLAR